jgi:hypothetical protein
MGSLTAFMTTKVLLLGLKRRTLRQVLVMLGLVIGGMIVISRLASREQLGGWAGAVAFGMWVAVPVWYTIAANRLWIVVKKEDVSIYPCGPSLGTFRLKGAVPGAVVFRQQESMLAFTQDGKSVSCGPFIINSEESLRYYLDTWRKVAELLRWRFLIDDAIYNGDAFESVSRAQKKTYRVPPTHDRNLMCVEAAVMGLVLRVMIDFWHQLTWLYLGLCAVLVFLLHFFFRWLRQRSR